MNPNIPERAAERDRGVINPDPGAFGGLVTELRMRKLRRADAVFRNPAPHQVNGQVVAHILRHAEQHTGIFGSRQHRARLLL